MDIVKSLEWRYACKKFDKERKLGEEQIDRLKKAFVLTPTSFGLQPIKLVVIESLDLREKLLPHAYYQPQITTCSHLLVICIDKSFGLDAIDEKFDLEKEIRGTGEEIVGKFRKQLKQIFEKKDAETIEKESIYQAYIALGNLMTVCAQMHVDSCPMEGFKPTEFDTVLRLRERDLRSVLLLPVGYRAEDDIMHKMKKVRRPIDEVVIDLD